MGNDRKVRLMAPNRSGSKILRQLRQEAENLSFAIRTREFLLYLPVALDGF